MHGKVFLACALGGGVGALVALQIWQSFWWVGLVVGGFVGYLSYDFQAVIRAIPQAWWMAREVEVDVNWRQLIEMAIGLLLVASAFAPGFVLMGMYPKDDLGVLLSLTLVFVSGAMMIVVVFGEETIQAETLIVIGKRINLVTVYGYYLPLVIWWVARRTPRAVAAVAMAVGRFVKYLFILIHSELRLLCAFDAAFGAAIGYFLGNAAIGALAGGVIGVLNYELISKRLLHLVPSR